MKLNPDCIRDVLIYLEDNLVYDDTKYLLGFVHIPIRISEVIEGVQTSDNYDFDEVKYTIEKLIEARYITINKITENRDKKPLNCSISDITYEGHQFLNTIRPQSVWDATKKCASKLGLSSIHALSSIAMKIVDTVIADPNIINKITSFI